MVVDSHHGKDKVPPNQPRGSIEQMDDDTAGTDDISGGPMSNRLLSTMRVEHRPEEKENVNGTANGESSMNGVNAGDFGADSTAEAINDGRPSATFFHESTAPGWRVPIAKQDFGQVDERLKAELRNIGFIGQDEEPDYDAHYDDEVAQRLRFLQSELRKQMIINGARKARLLQIAQEHMAYQEFTTIRDDLDTQVVQAYSKRNRTLGKSKKNTKRPGGAGGGSHYPPGGVGAGGSKSSVTDQVVNLMDKRKRWNDIIGPIFSEDVTKVRGVDDSIFREEDMASFLAAEKERLDDEVE